MTDPTPRAEEVLVSDAAGSTSGLWKHLRVKPTFWVSSVILTIVVLLLLFPGWFADSAATDSLTGGCQLKNSLLPPSGEFWFGTDRQGCDLYTLTIYGTRPSVMVGVVGTVAAVLIGVIVGATAGFFGGWVDSLLSRVVDVFYGVPLILGGIVLLTAVDLPGIWGVVLLLAILGWVTAARMVRASIIEAKQEDYVLGARALGVSNTRLLYRHLLPASFGPLLVLAVFGLGAFIAAEATFSFLGLGIQPPDVSWGSIISDAEVTFSSAPWTLFFPAAFLVIAILGFVLMGEALRDVLDPKRRSM